MTASSVPTEHRPKGRRPLLTPEVQNEICSYIRKGAFSQVAAQRCGIARQTFWEWMARGEGGSARRADKIYADFAVAVREAQAEARIKAESAVLEKDPRTWLLHGPGRDKGPDDPGWTTRVETEVSGPGGGPVKVDHGFDITGILANPVALAASHALRGALADKPRGDGDGAEPESA